MMAGNDIKLPIFNGNGLEDPEQHWFLCESVWTMQQVQYEVIKQAQMIIILRGHALEWYMNISIVLEGVALKQLRKFEWDQQTSLKI